MPKIQQLIQDQTRYQVTHPLIGSKTFDSWTDLCEAALEAGQEEATSLMRKEFVELACRISDEIVEKAVEL